MKDNNFVVFIKFVFHFSWLRVTLLGIGAAIFNAIPWLDENPNAYTPVGKEERTAMNRQSIALAVTAGAGLVGWKTAKSWKRAIWCVAVAMLAMFGLGHINSEKTLRPRQVG